MEPGMNWRTMMGVVVVEGTLVTVLVITNVREQVMRAIPLNLKRAIGVGIGIFIAFLGLQQMGWVVKGAGGGLLTHGTFTLRTTVVATAGLLLLVTLQAWRVRGSILLGILGTAVIAWLGDMVVPGSAPLARLPDRVFLAPGFLDLRSGRYPECPAPRASGGDLCVSRHDFFDTMGTVIGSGRPGGISGCSGKPAAIEPGAAGGFARRRVGWRLRSKFRDHLH